MFRQKGNKFVPHDKEKGLFCPGFHRCLEDFIESVCAGWIVVVY